MVIIVLPIRSYSLKRQVVRTGRGKVSPERADAENVLEEGTSNEGGSVSPIPVVDEKAKGGQSSSRASETTKIADGEDCPSEVDRRQITYAPSTHNPEEAHPTKEKQRIDS